LQWKVFMDEARGGKWQWGAWMPRNVHAARADVTGLTHSMGMIVHWHCLALVHGVGQGTRRQGCSGMRFSDQRHKACFSGGLPT